MLFLLGLMLLLLLNLLLLPMLSLILLLPLLFWLSLVLPGLNLLLDLRLPRRRLKRLRCFLPVILGSSGYLRLLPGMRLSRIGAAFRS